MKLLTAEQLRALDRSAIDSFGVPSTLLMTNAAQCVGRAALERLGPDGRAAVFCGAGNNGGDGVAAAAFLLKNGVTVRAFLVGDRRKMTDDTREMERRLGELGGALEDFAGAADLDDYMSRCGVVIDALFGTGLRSELRGGALEAVRLMNASSAYIIAADIPSGVEADTGAILGSAVSADLTVTFSFAKPGLFIEPGCTRCGKVLVADIGIPPSLCEKAEAACWAVTEGDVTLPRRKPDTHKGDYGRALIVAGSIGYTGAPALAAKAATMAGAGLVTLAVPEAVYSIAAVKCSEEIVVPLPGSAEGTLSSLSLYPILDHLKKSDVCLIGPGLGRSPFVTELVSAVIRSSEIPLILDADGINAAAENIDILDEARCPVLLTPHAGEFRRLGGDVSKGRLTEARRFASAHGAVLVLKGHRTITALPDGSAYINTSGGPAMAKGGTGDVLAGVLTALVGQKFPIKDAALAAVWLHGRAGDLACEKYGEYSVTASTIISSLPEAFKSAVISQ